LNKRGRGRNGGQNPQESGNGLAVVAEATIVEGHQLLGLNVGSWNRGIAADSGVDFVQSLVQDLSGGVDLVDQEVNHEGQQHVGHSDVLELVIHNALASSVISVANSASIIRSITIRENIDEQLGSNVGISSMVVDEEVSPGEAGQTGGTGQVGALGIGAEQNNIQLLTGGEGLVLTQSCSSGSYGHSGLIGHDGSGQQRRKASDGQTVRGKGWGQNWGGSVRQGRERNDGE